MNPTDRLGAWLGPTNCYFRVWAPHAQEVRVLTQNGPYWEDTDTITSQDLTQSGEYWTGTVASVQAWQLYRYEITGPGGQVIERLDPAGRDVLSSDLTRQDPSSRNGSVILGPDVIQWSAFQTPRFADFLIYQFHIGSFAGRSDEFNKFEATLNDVESKLGYIREMGFNCVQPLPVHEFAFNRSWGYNPSTYFAPESSYGSPYDLMHFVNTAHGKGLAVIFDVVYNLAGNTDNSLYHYDGWTHEDGIYFEGGQWTDWGRGPAWWKRDVQEFFYQNARMYLEEYRADGLRFDVTTQINGNHLKLVVERLRADFPSCWPDRSLSLA